MGTAVAVLFAPVGAALGVATLVSPTAARSVSCLNVGAAVDSPTGISAGSVTLVAAVPQSLTAVNTHGETITLTHRQLQRAAAIIATGTAEHVPARGQLIALMAALTESSLRVLSNTGAYPGSTGIPNDGNGSDHDSLGLFQMRPAAGWGTIAELMDPVWSSRAFYGGPVGPNHGSPRGLLDIPSWETLAPGAAAQAVEVSAYPDRYAVNQPVATAILTTLNGRTNGAVTGANTNTDSAGSADSTGTAITGTLCPPSPGAAASGPAGAPAGLPSGFAGALIAAAAKEIGTPYVWGGGTFTGPSGGGFDCSGLVLYAAYQASRGRLRLPHYTGDQIHQGRPIAWSDKQPGDLIFFSYPGAAGPHHVAIYLGGDRILHAPHTGDHVRYGTIGEFTGDTKTVRRLN
ncbi:C40 family peptidase [Nocardioides sp. AN3]